MKKYLGVILIYAVLALGSGTENERLSNSYNLSESIVVECRSVFDIKNYSRWDSEVKYDLEYTKKALEIVSNERFFFGLMGLNCRKLSSLARASGNKELYLERRYLEVIQEKHGDSIRDWEALDFSKKIDIVRLFFDVEAKELGLDKTVYDFELVSSFRSCLDDKAESVADKSEGYRRIFEECFKPFESRFVESVKTSHAGIAAAAEASMAELELSGIRSSTSHCYELGRKYGRCSARSMSGRPCRSENDISIPLECRNQEETRKGIRAGMEMAF